MGILRRYNAIFELLGNGGKEQKHRGDALLAVDDDTLTVGRLGHDTAKEVLLATILDHLDEIVEQTSAVLRLPVVIALVDGDDETGVESANHLGKTLLGSIHVGAPPLLAFVPAVR